METKEETALRPIKEVDLTNEQIKDVLHLNVQGGDKMFLIFNSGNILVMPIHPECPVQVGTIHNLSEDLVGFIEELELKKAQMQVEVSNTIKKIQNLRGWHKATVGYKGPPRED